MQTLLQAPYSRDSWRGLLSSLFASAANLNITPDEITDGAFGSAFSRVVHLGDLATSDGKAAALLEIQVAPGVNLQRNRAGVRHLAARLLDGVTRQAILAAFHSAGSPDWRFSFILREASFDLATGQTTRRETPARRFTYLLGPSETCRTAAERFALLRDQAAAGQLPLSAIEEAFKVEKLTKEFYGQLSDWYFWALTKVRFPDDVEKDAETRNATMTIRLVTRLMFVWFLRKKGLVPETLFDKAAVDEWLNYSDSTGSTYYKAVLQNLFFATLNFDPREGRRDFVEWGRKGVLGYRYKRFFKRGQAERFLAVCKDIPFLNGGLFENLDKDIETASPRRVDCFSNCTSNEARLAVPDDLFFGHEQVVDLSAFYDDKRKSAVKVRGLFEILGSFNFTVEENTPYDQEVALDPELLGQVFENLLASYNPETRTTARKQTGSFYTPRAIVQYMVDESLVAFLKQAVDPALEPEYRKLVGFAEEPSALSPSQRSALVKALFHCRILDPACGSGAFPMGVLQQLVHLLNQLDPANTYLKQQALAQLRDETNAVADADDPVEHKMEKMRDTLRLFDETATRPDYARKLYLIENCIFGVDIQPVAVQIAKLRFFISLVVEQDAKEDIRPLPNLETNFVAANTLIGIHKPAGLLFAADPQVAALEKELKANRHRHFFARTQASKRKYREEDRRLRDRLQNRLVEIATTPDREAIARQQAMLAKLQEDRTRYLAEKWVERDQTVQTELFAETAPQQQTIPLRVDIHKEKRDQIDAAIRACKAKLAAEEAKGKNDAFTREAAKLAFWDPYDQNASSPFFDPEWMFGVSDGFDIVIGNPPYIPIEAIPENEKQEYECAYIELSRKYDTSVIFILRGMDLACKSGSITYITSVSWQTGENFSAIRRRIFETGGMTLLVNLPFDVFKAAYVDAGIYVISRRPTAQYLVYEFPKDAQSLEMHSIGLQTVRVDLITAPGYKLVTHPRAAAITHRISSAVKHRSLGDISVSTQGLAGNRFTPSANPKGPHIDQYVCRGQVYRYIVSIDSTFAVDMSDKETLRSFYARGPKILIRRVINRQDRLMAGFLESPHVFKKDVNPFRITDLQFNPKFILGLLNSRFISFLYVSASSIALKDDFRQTTLAELRRLPIPDIAPAEQQPLVALVDRILAAKKADPAANTSTLEVEIDRRVYALYGLTDAEIAIVEGKA